MAELVARGAIGGRTVRIDQAGNVGWDEFPVPPLAPGSVRIHTQRSAVSPGTEMTFVGRNATNPYLRKHWDEDLRLFMPGAPSMDHPIFFGYRAAGEVVESGDGAVPAGTRIFGSWWHTELISMQAATAQQQVMHEDLAWEDGVDIAQVGPICINAVAFAEGAHAGHPAVVFGAGPIGLITAQVVRATGATEVHVVDRLAYRLGLAQGLGFVPVDASSVDVAASLKRALGAESVPVAFECAGASAALHEAIRVVRRRGVVVALGFYQGPASALFLGEEFHHNGVQVRSGQIGNIHPDWNWGSLRLRTVELVRGGALVLGGLPRLTLPVERVAEGFEALKRPDEVLQVALSYDR